MEITGIIIAKNEENTIGKAVKSLSFCKHIIVADDGSTDKTVETARRNGADIFNLPSVGSFALKRTLAMKHAGTDWVLFLDADEEITPELGVEIKKVQSDSDTVAFYLRRRDFWWGKELKYGETGKARNKGICRLFKKGSGRFAGEVHEEWRSQGQVKALSGFINHYPHPTMREFIADVNDYSSRRAAELHSRGVRSSLFQLWAYPLFKFILTYFVYLGFMDGPAGFVYSFMMSFHSFLVRSKLYQYAKLET